jgi:hypothetical protein
LTSNIRGITGMMPIIERDAKDYKEKVKRLKKDHKEELFDLKRSLNDALDK